MVEATRALFHKNLLYLQHSFPELYKQILLSKDEVRIDIIPFNDDFHLVYNDRVLKYIDALSMQKIATLHEDIVVFNFLPSYQDALYQSLPVLPSQMVDSDALRNRAHALVVFGLAPFFHIEKMIELGVKKVAFFEPDIGNFIAFLHLFDLEGFFYNAKKKGVVLEFFVADVEALHRDFMRSFYLPILSGELVLRYHSSHGEKIASLKGRIAESFKSVELISGKEYFKRECENFLCNIKSDHFYLKSKEVIQEPCLVVGSGPSLEKYLPVLREIQHRVVIVSLTSTFKILYENGIGADLLTIVDPRISKVQIDVLKGAYEGLKSVVTLGTIGVDCELLGESEKSVITHFSIFGSLFEEQPLQRRFFLYTVLDLTLNVLFDSGASKIGLIGIDLGTKDLSKLHAKGYALNDHLYNSTIFECEGNFGGKVFSPIDFYRTKESVEKMVDFYEKQRSLELLNFSEGVKIKGFRAASMQDLETFFCKKEYFHRQLQTLFSKELPKRKEVKWDMVLLAIKDIMAAINSANEVKFQRGVKRLFQRFAFFGNLHNIYYLRMLAKINMLLYLSSNPKQEFQKLLKQHRNALKHEMKILYDLIHSISKTIVGEEQFSN